MEQLLQWVKKLAVFMILSSYMEHLLPTGYRRYFHMCMGLILILMIASPLVQIINGSVGSDFACLLEDLRIGSSVYQMEDEGASGLAENFQSYYMEQYREAVAAQIRQLAQGCGLTVVQLDFEVEEDGNSEQYGQIQSLSMTVENGAGISEGNGAGISGENGTGISGETGTGISGETGTGVSEAVAELRKSLTSQLGLAESQIQVKTEQATQ